MIRFLSIVVLLLAALPSQSEAGLIRVRFDDFTLGTQSGTVFNFNGFVVNRSASLSGGGTFSGAFGIAGPGSVDLTYTITSGQTFEDLFDFYKTGAPASPYGTLNPRAGTFDGFGFNIGFFVPGTDATASINYGGPYLGAQSVSGFGGFEFRPLADTSTVTFSLNSNGGFLTMNAVSAVPEPTALLMVGSVLALGAGVVTRRRRRA